MNSNFIFLFFIVALFTVSCSQQRYLYSPTKPNTPVLQKRGDSRLNTSFSFGNARGFGDSSKNLGADVQAALAVTNHIAIIGSYYSRTEADAMRENYRRAVSFTSSFVNYRRRYWEAGIGYFTALSGEALFQVFAGGTFGQLTINDVGFMDSLSYSRFHNTRINKLFVQPGFSFIDRGGAGCNLTLKLNLLQLHTKSTNYTAAELDYFPVNGPGTSLQLFMAEPSLTVFLPIPRTDWLKWEGSITSIFNPTYYRTRGWSMSFGLTIDPVKAFK